MLDLLRQSKISVEPKKNKYRNFGFTQNPFPANPSIKVDSSDSRENGSIYLPELREKEQSTFEKLLIPQADSTQAYSIAFLMDYATRRGRGIGKTSFLHHQRTRIMNDFGNQLSGGSAVMFAIYLLPLPSGRTRKFWQISKLIVQALIEQDIIAMAMWRLRAFSGVIPDEVLAQIGSQPQNTIGNDSWLQDKKVDVFWGVSHSIREKLRGLDIDDDLVEKLTNFGCSAESFKQNYYDKLSDHAWRSDDGEACFNDLVKLLIAAGFTKGLILVDEVEKIITPQNTQERRDFTDTLRYFFIDGQNENAKFSFYSLLLTIHPYVQELLNPHWSATGLDRFADLSGDMASQYTIYLEPLNQQSAIPLALAYLDASRISQEHHGELAPFSEKAIEEALVLSGRVPGIYLRLLNQAIEKAILLGWQTIEVSHIKSIAQTQTPKEPNSLDKISPLPAAQIDLRAS